LALRPVTLVEAFYKGMQVSMEKLGDFLREVAALVLVFIPLDLWKNEITWMRSIGVIAVSGMLFIFGIGCEFTALAVKRGRDRYEEEKSYDPG
jgi:hypothetical protein